MCAKRNTEDAFFANLAARAFQEGKETETAVLILREMLAQSLSPVVEEKIKIRLIAFETVLFLETALQKYRTIHGVSATSLSDLIDSALLTEIPPDPYGGKFYLDLDGSVKTTSRFAFPKESEKKK